MKNKYFILSLFILIHLTAYSQITVTLSSCGADVFNASGTDSTGRNIYLDGAGFAVQWSASASQWQIVQLPSSVGYSNTFASKPNPPCLGAGTWQLIQPGCGTVSGFSGTCQSVLTDVEDIVAKNEINVYPNPSYGQFNFTGLENESSIEIYDMTGRLILETISNTSTATIDFNGKDKGIYLYKIIDKHNIVKQGKLSLV